MGKTNNTTERSYSVQIVASSKELTKTEKVKFKDTTTCIRVDDASKEKTLIFRPDFWVEIEVHNENATTDKDYKQLIIVDTDGNKYITGSKNFRETFLDIFTDLYGEDYEVQVVRKPSKNFKNKEFLTCAIV